MQNIFAALSHKDTMDALVYLYHKPERYVFDSAVLAKACGVSYEEMERVLDDLLLLKSVWRKKVVINGEARTLYYSRPSHILIALFLMARQIGYEGAYRLQSHNRKTPFIHE